MTATVLAEFYMPELAEFVRATVNGFDSELVLVKDEEALHEVMYKFQEDGDDNLDTRKRYRGFDILQLSYEYKGYNLYVYYYGHRLLLLLIDGRVGGFGVTSEALWDRNLLG
jgi:hypothetical protein